MKDIVEIVCDFYGIYHKKVFMQDRKRDIVKCRQVSMYIIRQLTNYSLPKIGNFFMKDHSSVLHSINAVDDDMITNSGFRAEVAILITRCENRLIEIESQSKYCIPMVFNYSA